MMKTQDAYIVVDIGTGNVRVAVVNPAGTLLGVGRADIRYLRDERYPESIYFEPDQLWQQVLTLAATALQEAGPVRIRALTTTSQREGIVLMAADGRSLIGLPNIDHRGRQWEDEIADKSRVYRLTGRPPTSLFSASKLEGIRQGRPELWAVTQYFLSISDWAEYQLSGIARYEHSQASETLLYDVARGQWSPELAQTFGMEPSLMPPLAPAGIQSGSLLPALAARLGISGDAAIVTGGGDTQLAIKSTQPSVDDIVIVSGTTTPIVKIVDAYITDADERTWTSRDIHPGRFIFEANAGVTGLNYQRLKEVFYPNEGYETIEKELADNPHRHCMAALGSLVASESGPLTSGGFIFPVPVSHELSRSSFVWATLLDITFSIAENYRVLTEVSGHQADYVWACGGGLQSRTLRQLIANVLNKRVQVRRGFEQASAVGGAMLCNQALGLSESQGATAVESVGPQPHRLPEFEVLWQRWTATRSHFKKLSREGQ